MGKIIGYFVSDYLGRPLVMIGAGKILKLIKDYSSDKRSERLVLNVLIEFDNKTQKQVVIKLGLTEKDLKTKSNTKYTSKFSNETYHNLTLENQFYQEVIIANFLKENITSPQLTNKILPVLGAGILIDNTITINGESFNLIDLDLITSDISSKENVTYLVTEYNPSFKVLAIDGIATSWFSEIPAQKIYNLITSGIDILEYTYEKYKFCHWDFHGENIIYDNNTGLVKLFDFDLSTIGNHELVTDSQYLERVEYFYTLIDNIKHSQGIFEDKIIKYKSFEDTKYKLAHYFDLFQFLKNTQDNIKKTYKSFNKDQSDTIEFYLPDLGLENINEYNKLITSFKKVYTDFHLLIDLYNVKLTWIIQQNPDIKSTSHLIVNLTTKIMEELQFSPLETNFINFAKQFIDDTLDSIKYMRALYIFCAALLLKYDYHNLSSRIEYVIKKYEVPERDYDVIEEIDESDESEDDEYSPSVENLEKITREIEELKKQLLS